MRYLCIVAVLGSFVGLLFCIKTKKLQMYGQEFGVFFASSLLALLVAVTGARGQGTSDLQLLRPEPGEASRSEEYELCVEELAICEPYEVLVEQRHLDEKEREELFEQAIAELEQTFLGANVSLDHITKKVEPVDAVCEGRVDVSWTFDDYAVLNLSGELQEEALTETGTLVAVTAVLTYEEAVVTHRFSVMVYPPEKTPIELFYKRLAQIFAEKNAATDAKLTLPQEAGGYQLHWKKKQSQQPYEILALGFLAMLGIAIGKKEDARKAQAKRREQLLAQYPQMLGQLALLIGAGMTVSQAWEKLVQNYEMRRKRAPQADIQPVYEEMRMTYYQMKDGLGERRAYEQFGERLGLAVYRRFATLLVQNLRKGTAGLHRLLEKEMQAAREEQESAAKKRGEEMQTKLLLPMMLMLALVVVIIMIPAMASFQM